MTELNNGFEEKRRYRRLELDLPIAFEIISNDTRDCSINFAKTRNVSTGGAYFEFISDCDIQKDMRIKVVFDTPDYSSDLDMSNIFKNPKLETSAKVLRTTDIVEKDRDTGICTRKARGSSDV